MASCNLHYQENSCCDNVWTLFLGEDYDEVEDDTIGGTTTAGQSQLYESSPQKTKKMVSKKDPLSEEDQVKQYFLGADDSDDDDGRARKTFRRRRKKLQSAHNLPVDETVHVAPHTIWVETPLCNDGSVNSTGIIMPPQCGLGDDIQSETVDKYSTGGVNSILSCNDSASEITSPTFHSLQEDRPRTHTSPYIESIQEDQRKSKKGKKWWKSRPAGGSLREVKPQKGGRLSHSADQEYEEDSTIISMQEENMGSAEVYMSEARNDTERDSRNHLAHQASRKAFQDTEESSRRRFLPATLRRKRDGNKEEFAIKSREKDMVRRQDRKTLAVEEERWMIHSTASEHGSERRSRTIGNDRKDLLSVASDICSEMHPLRRIPRGDRTIAERPPRPPTSGEFSVKRERRNNFPQEDEFRSERDYYERPKRNHVDNDARSPKPSRVSAEQKLFRQDSHRSKHSPGPRSQKHEAESDPTFDSELPPISDISRRELELRSFGVTGGSRDRSALRMGGRGHSGSDHGHPRSSAREEASHGDTKGVPRNQNKMNGRRLSVRRESEFVDSRRKSERSKVSPNAHGNEYEFIDLTFSADVAPGKRPLDNDSYDAMPASMKLEIGARAARQRSEKGARPESDGSFRPRRFSSVPKQRRSSLPDPRVILAAGSLHL